MMDLIPQEVLLDWAGKVARLKMFPYFCIADYIMMCLSVRDDLGSNASAFSRKHPLATWLSCMLMCFSGAFLAYFLMGEPVVLPFKHQNEFLYATIVWYLVFYSPFDISYTITKWKPMYLVINIMKEMYRAHKVQAGVMLAAKAYPNAVLIMIIIGTAKGAGHGVVKTAEQLARGVWSPSHHEFLKPSFYTKSCVLASILFVIEKKTTWLTGYPHEVIFLCVTGFFVYFKLNAELFHIHDPMAPIENVFCAFFLGGIWDALGRAIQASKDRRAAVQAGTDPIEAKKDL